MKRTAFPRSWKLRRSWLRECEASFIISKGAAGFSLADGALSWTPALVLFLATPCLGGCRLKSVGSIRHHSGSYPAPDVKGEGGGGIKGRTIHRTLRHFQMTHSLVFF